MTALASPAVIGGVFTFEVFPNRAALERGDEPVKVIKKHNLWTNAGLTAAMSRALLGGAQVTAFYVGLMDGSATPAAGDTMGSHAGWTELTEYDEANRQTWTGVAGAAGAATNAASRAVFTINAGVTLGGVFLTTDSTKGGTTGTLMLATALSGDEVLADDYVVRVTYAPSITG